MDYWLIGELAFTGALVGLMYALVAVGIVLVYKTSGVANFAQGAIAMTGGYATWAISAGLGLPMWAAIPLALAMMFALGMLIERAVLQHMIGQPVIMIIMVTFGLEIFLRGVMPGTFGVAVKRLSLDIPQAPIFLGEMLINRAYLVGGGISALIIIATIMLFNSRAGIIMRAVSDDQGASWSVGIRVERAIAMAWGLAAGTAQRRRHLADRVPPLILRTGPTDAEPLIGWVADELNEAPVLAGTVSRNRIWVCTTP